MALTTRVNGSVVGGNPNNIKASWFNDFNNLFTGAMTDQPVTFNYRPGAATSPTLSLKGDGQNPLLRGYDTDNTTVVATLDHSGNLTLAGNLTIKGGKNAVYANSGLTGKLDAQNTAPSSPATGDLWLDTSVVLS